jgi:hypothetical protein
MSIDCPIRIVDVTRETLWCVEREHCDDVPRPSMIPHSMRGWLSQLLQRMRWLARSREGERC